MIPWKRFLITFVVFSVGVHLIAQPNEKNLPNLLWITFEDCDPILGVYGDPLAQTPNLDRFAKRGIRFDQAWANAPVCAPSRTAIITGRYPTSLGADHMRSLVPIEEEVKLLPELLKSAGYYCTNAHKEDYNLVLGRKVWDHSHIQAHWRNRAPGQPFFSVFNLGMTHESGLWSEVDISGIDLSKITVPPYYPDLPEIREALARQYANLQRVDQAVQKILDQLEQDGLSDNTLIFIFSDHGSGMPRHKRWLYAQGLKVPMLAHFPERWKSQAKPLLSEEAQGVSQRLVSFVDLAPTMLSLAGVPIPQGMEGRAFAGNAAQEVRNTHFAFRGRMDEVTDFSRSATDGRYLYVRNYHYERPQGETSSYQWNNEAVRAWKAAYDAQRLNSAQAAYWKPKAYEEFYDLNADPYALNNLVEVTAHPQLSKLRAELDRHMISTRDQGLIPESMRHSLSKGEALRAAFSKDTRFKPVETLRLAGLASTVHFSEKLPFITALKKEDPILQYWGAVGLVHRSDLTKDDSTLKELMEHEHVEVQRIAAEKLLSSPNESRRKEAVEVLLAMAATPGENYFAALEALGSLRRAPKELLPRERLQKMESLPRNVPSRVADFYPRQLKQLLLLKEKS